MSPEAVNKDCFPGDALHGNGYRAAITGLHLAFEDVIFCDSDRSHSAVFTISAFGSLKVKSGAGLSIDCAYLALAAFFCSLWSMEPIVKARRVVGRSRR